MFVKQALQSWGLYCYIKIKKSDIGLSINSSGLRIGYVPEAV